MDRRKFLGNLLGAGIVAAIPKPVFDAIVSAETTKPVVSKYFNPNGTGLWILDEHTNEVVGYTGTAELNMFRNKQYFELAPAPAEYIPAPLTYDVMGYNMHLPANKTLVTDKIEHAYNKKYRMVVTADTGKVYGDVYMTDITMQVNHNNEVVCNAKFTGCGALTLVLQRGDTLKTVQSR